MTRGDAGYGARLAMSSRCGPLPAIKGGHGSKADDIESGSRARCERDEAPRSRVGPRRQGEGPRVCCGVEGQEADAGDAEHRRSRPTPPAASQRARSPAMPTRTGAKKGTARDPWVPGGTEELVGEGREGRAESSSTPICERPLGQSLVLTQAHPRVFHESVQNRRNDSRTATRGPAPKTRERRTALRRSGACGAWVEGGSDQRMRKRPPMEMCPWERRCERRWCTTRVGTHTRRTMRLRGIQTL